MKSVCVFSLASGFHHGNILNMTSFLNRFPPACLPDIRPSLFWSGLSNSYMRLSRSYQWSLDTSRVFLGYSVHRCLPMAVSCDHVLHNGFKAIYCRQDKACHSWDEYFGVLVPSSCRKPFAGFRP